MKINMNILIINNTIKDVKKRIITRINGKVIARNTLVFKLIRFLPLNFKLLNLKNTKNENKNKIKITSFQKAIFCIV